VIPALLWRCPLCTTHEALVHKRSFLRPEVVYCTACRARWRVRRIPGDDFYLRLVEPPSGGSTPSEQELSLATWYDRMKTGLRLVSVQDPSFPLHPQETLYLASQAVELWVAAGDRLAGSQALEADETPGAVSPADSPPKSYPTGEDLVVLAGSGRLFLTNQRLAWQSQEKPENFPHACIQGVHAIVNLGLAVTVGMRLVFFRFLSESPLKWVSYFSLVAEAVQAETGRPIAISHW
jgi:hypothetical protein